MKKLSKKSWLWFRNKSINKEDLLWVFEILEENIELADDLDYISNQIADWKELYGLYDSLLVERISFHQGCGEYRDITYLVGARKETSSERDQRLQEEKDEEKKKKKEELAELKRKKNKEYQKFLKLKEKFEPKTGIERTQELNKKLKKLGVSLNVNKKGGSSE